MIIGTWKEKNLQVRILFAFEGRYGETRIMVCKATCPNPTMGQFSLRPEDIDGLDDYLAGVTA